MGSVSNIEKYYNRDTCYMPSTKGQDLDDHIITVCNICKFCYVIILTSVCILYLFVLYVADIPETKIPLGAKCGACRLSASEQYFVHKEDLANNGVRSSRPAEKTAALHSKCSTLL